VTHATVREDVMSIEVQQLHPYDIVSDTVMSADTAGGDVLHVPRAD
jgi:hypothetical protein